MKYEEKKRNKDPPIFRQFYFTKHSLIPNT